MKVCVVGAGIMGSGIAQLASQARHHVSLCDVDDEALTAARAAITSSLSRFAAKGTMTEEDVDGVWQRLTFTREPDGMADADIVIEAVPETLDLKHRVFEEIAELAPREALLGTNTSQLSITSIGTILGDRASRLVGLHFFNPPVLMRLVEVVRGLHTTDRTIRDAKSFAESLDREVVVCEKDSPGFLTSRISAILRLECARMLDEGLASAADIDKAIRLAFNHPMGPLELGDFNGLDTFMHALTNLEVVFGDRFKPTVGLRNMVAAGQLGRKAGIGYYDYRATGPR